MDLKFLQQLLSGPITQGTGIPEGREAAATFKTPTAEERRAQFAARFAQAPAPYDQVDPNLGGLQYTPEPVPAKNYPPLSGSGSMNDQLFNSLQQASGFVDPDLGGVQNFPVPQKNYGPFDVPGSMVSNDQLALDTFVDPDLGGVQYRDPLPVPYGRPSALSGAAQAALSNVQEAQALEEESVPSNLGGVQNFGPSPYVAAAQKTVADSRADALSKATPFFSQVGKAVTDIGEATDYVTDGVSTAVDMVADTADYVGSNIADDYTKGAEGGTPNKEWKTVAELNADKETVPELAAAPPEVDEETDDINISSQTQETLEVAEEKLIKVNPEAKELISAAKTVDPESLSTISESDNQLIESEAIKAATDIKDPSVKEDPKTIMEKAGSMLGEIFSDPAVRRALIYYTGSRLLGFSGVGSGQILVSGWNQQSKNEQAMKIAKMEAAIRKETGDARIEAAKVLAKAKKEESDSDKTDAKTKADKLWTTPNLDSTATFFDELSNVRYTGNVAPNGDLYYSQGGKQYVVNVNKAGLVSNDKSVHKTHGEQKIELLNSTTKSMEAILRDLDDNGEFTQVTRDTFRDGVNVSEMVNNIARKFKNTNLDMNNAEFMMVLNNSVIKSVQRMAKQGPNENRLLSGDLSSMAESMMIQTNVLGGDKVPQFVFNKASSWNKGNPEAKVSGFLMDPVLTTDMMTTAKNLTMSQITKALGNNPTEEQKVNAYSNITPTNTFARLGAMFKKNVMSDPKASEYWNSKAGKDTNAFGAWLTSGRNNVKHEHKYMGFNSPKMLKMVDNLYN